MNPMEIPKVQVGSISVLGRWHLPELRTLLDLT